MIALNSLFKSINHSKVILPIISYNELIGFSGHHLPRIPGNLAIFPEKMGSSHKIYGSILTKMGKLLYS